MGEISIYESFGRYGKIIYTYRIENFPITLENFDNFLQKLTKKKRELISSLLNSKGEAWYKSNSGLSKLSIKKDQDMIVLNGIASRLTFRNLCLNHQEVVWQRERRPRLIDKELITV